MKVQPSSSLLSGRSLAVRERPGDGDVNFKNSRRSCVALTLRRKRENGQRRPSGLSRSAGLAFESHLLVEMEMRRHESLKNYISELDDWIVSCLQSNESLLCGLFNVKFSISRICSVNWYQIICTGTSPRKRRQMIGDTLKNHISALNYRIALSLVSN
jgi:hypothetical protein